MITDSRNHRFDIDKLQKALNAFAPTGIVVSVINNNTDRRINLTTEFKNNDVSIVVNAEIGSLKFELQLELQDSSICDETIQIFNNFYDKISAFSQRGFESRMSVEVLNCYVDAILETGIASRAILKIT